MQIYFLITGILSILYYLILVFYSRRLRSTFAVFWVILGGAHLVIGCAPLPVYMYTVLGVLCTAGWCIFIMIEVRIIKAMLSRCDRHADYIIILGAQVRGKKITDSLKRRLDKRTGIPAAFSGHKSDRIRRPGGQGRTFQKRMPWPAT